MATGDAGRDPDRQTPGPEGDRGHGGGRGPGSAEGPEGSGHPGAAPSGQGRHGHAHPHLPPHTHLGGHPHPEPVDPDIDFGPAAPAPGLPAVVGVVAAGGALGALARYGAARLWPTAGAAFPWTTLCVNALGCAVIGVFLVVVTEIRQTHPLVRPFFGTGVLGGFTTFSTYAVDIERLVKAHRPGVAVGYLAATLVAALVCVWTAATATRWFAARRAPSPQGGAA